MVDGGAAIGLTCYDASNRTYVEPKLMMSPSLSTVSPWMRTPFTIVPLVDPRSTTT